MKKISLLLMLCMVISLAEESYMVIYRKSGPPLIEKVTEIDSIKFNPQEFNCLVLHNAFLIFQRYYFIQGCWQAETNEFAPLTTLESGNYFHLPSEDKYFTYYEVSTGIIEACAKTSISDIPQNSIVGIDMTNDSYPLIPIYTANGLDSTIVNECYNNFRSN